MTGQDLEPKLKTARAIVAPLLALASASLFLVLVFEDLGALASASWSDVPWGLIMRYLLAMAAAGALCGMLFAGMFGRSGVAGWALAAVAGVISSTVAGLIGSAFGLLPDILAHGFFAGVWIAIGAGALVLPFALAGWPPLVVLWLILLAVTHLRIRQLRRTAA